MQIYNREKAIKQINTLAYAHKPFIFIINYAQDKSYIEEVEMVNPSILLYNLNGFTNVGGQHTPLQKEIYWDITQVSFSEYTQSFTTVKNNILAGNSFLTNLTCRTPITTNLNLKEIFFQSDARYKLWLRNQFVVFSPEIFVRIQNGIIKSFPMKGTIDATLPFAEEILRGDEKEIAEHATIVDLIRNDLSMVAEQVCVERYRYIDRISTNHGPILQTSSEITGKLQKGYLSSLGTILFRLLPAGSITGAPKKKTTEIIANAESYNRGFYTGIAGYFDGNNVDSFVMIRFIEQENNRLYFRSGGGITCKSEAESEYNEMIQKVYVPIY